MKKIFVLFLLFFCLPAHANMMGDGIGMCGAFASNAVVASLKANSYTCNTGTYLPKQSTTCVACPTGFKCDGGTYVFSETQDQGLIAKEYECNNGYFLPAASETCAACPHGYSCAGGTFHYNAIDHQGLTRVATYYTANESNACAANFGHYMHAVFTPNQIEIIWQDAAQADVTANDARYVTYGTDIRTPANPPPHIPGKVFTGWKFIPAQ